jgi:hypothetical protein
MISARRALGGSGTRQLVAPGRRTMSTEDRVGASAGLAAGLMTGRPLIALGVVFGTLVGYNILKRQNY